MSNQKNKKMIITGGELGIGRGIVHYFAEKGYDIVFSYHSKPEEAEKLTAMYNSRYNSKVQGIYTDFSERREHMIFFAKPSNCWMVWMCLLIMQDRVFPNSYML